MEPGSPSSGCSRGCDLLRLSLKPEAGGLGRLCKPGSRELTSKSTFSPSGILGAVSLKKREWLMSMVSGSPPGDCCSYQMYSPLSPEWLDPSRSL